MKQITQKNCPGMVSKITSVLSEPDYLFLKTFLVYYILLRFPSFVYSLFYSVLFVFNCVFFVSFFILKCFWLCFNYVLLRFIYVVMVFSLCFCVFSLFLLWFL